MTGLLEKDFQKELRALSIAELVDLYVRLLAAARYLLTRIRGPQICLIEPNDLVHEAYLRVDLADSRYGNSKSLFWHLVNLMRHKLQSVAKTFANALPHLPLEDFHEDGTAILADVADDPEHRAIATELLRRLFALISPKRALLEYLDARLRNPGASSAEYAEVLGISVAEVRNRHKALKRLRARLLEETP